MGRPWIGVVTSTIACAACPCCVCEGVSLSVCLARPCHRCPRCSPRPSRAGICYTTCEKLRNKCHVCVQDCIFSRVPLSRRTESRNAPRPTGARRDTISRRVQRPRGESFFVSFRRSRRLYVYRASGRVRAHRHRVSLTLFQARDPGQRPQVEHKRDSLDVHGQPVSKRIIVCDPCWTILEKE